MKNYMQVIAAKLAAAYESLQNRIASINTSHQSLWGGAAPLSYQDFVAAIKGDLDPASPLYNAANVARWTSPAAYQEYLAQWHGQSAPGVIPGSDLPPTVEPPTS